MKSILLNDRLTKCLTLFFTILVISFGVFSLSAYSAYAAGPVAFTRDLKVGDRGQEVLLLQRLLNVDKDTQITSAGSGSPGLETDYFGALTKVAVMKFQNKYRQEVLHPAGLFSPSGYVGVMTRTKLAKLAVAGASAAPRVVPTTPVSVTSKAPSVLSVTPNRVRRGDTVTVTGVNFTPTNNTIILGDGPIDTRFENLPSPDGKTIAFTYQPPEVPTMTEAQVRALPADIVEKIEKPAKAAGVTLADVLTPYKGLQNEAELKTFLEKNGHSFDEMYHYFWVIVKNERGSGMSTTALLHGLRKFPFDTVVRDSASSLFSGIGQRIADFVGKIFPVAHAQLYGGGTTTGVLFPCTCGDGVMTYQVDILGKGTGLYWFSSGFVPTVGSGRIAGLWLGYYIEEAGQCVMAATPCFDIPGNIPQLPVGYSL